jgi:hypothetical protein
MVAEGRKKHILSNEDAQIILSRIQEPYIQKYLKSLAVHVCTLPVTQVVSIIVALWYKMANNLTWAQAWDEMLLILAFFQVIPLSPGSLVRGFYVLYLVIRERNFKDYNIAVFLGFFKYIGYLGLWRLTGRRKGCILCRFSESVGHCWSIGCSGFSITGR